MITKDLQDHVWKHFLPKEFKEEVKKIYNREIVRNDYEAGVITDTLAELFGVHNLTSDAEGEEEMLHVSRTKIEALHSEIHKAIMDAHDADDWQDAAHYILDILPRSFNALFGSKCLPDKADNEDNFASKEPTFKRGDIVRVTNARHSLYEGLIGTVDTVVKGRYREILVNHSGSLISFHASELKPYEEPKPAEPKFKVGDKVKDISSPHDDGVYIVDDIKKSSDGFIYHIQGLIGQSNVKESDLEPYTEPGEDHIGENHEMVDNILKDGFSNERRLNIAAKMMQALVCAPIIPGVDPNPPGRATCADSIQTGRRAHCRSRERR